jgi:hypothetical protein
MLEIRVAFRETRLQDFGAVVGWEEEESFISEIHV